MNYSKSSNSKNKIKSFLSDHHGSICQYCGQSTPVSQSTLDHIIAINKGGSNHISNLLYCCKSCNSSKGKRDIEEFRLFQSIQQSEYKGILTPKTYLQLLAIYALPRKVKLVTFQFEKAGDL